MRNWFYLLGAVFGFLGVALGAFGAHALEDVLLANERVDTWETAVKYHLLHALLLIGIGLIRDRQGGRWIKVAGVAASIGILVFSGSLYLLSVTNVTWLGAITPIGGLGFMLAWVAIFIHSLTSFNRNHDSHRNA